MDDPQKKLNLNRTIQAYIDEVGEANQRLVDSIKPIDPWKTPKWCHWVPPCKKPPCPPPPPPYNFD